MTPIIRIPERNPNRSLWTKLLLSVMASAALGIFTQAAAQTDQSADGSAKPGEKAKPAEEAKPTGTAATPAKSDTPESNPAVDPNVYRIGLSDQLMISVWKEPELSMSVVVRPDGMITLPLVNDLHVVGLKPIELQQLLIDKLKPFVSEPQVTVIVQGIRSRKVFLVGNVSKQGSYQLEGGETVLQLLAASGGLGPFAKGDSIYILRTENNRQVRIPFQYRKALKGKMKEDIPLQPGDVIVVP
jgi:polysaccharide biosynthesis/export protein